MAIATIPRSRVSASQRIVRYVRGRRTGATRGEIARATGLSYRTVSSVIQSLRYWGDITEAGRRNRARVVHSIVEG